MILKMIALFEMLMPADLEAVPPLTRRHFAMLCRHWADRADPPNEEPKAGVLRDLKEGKRAE